MFEQGRFLTSFLFQFFSGTQPAPVHGSDILADRIYDRSACLQKRTSVCRVRLLEYFFSIYVMNSTRMPLMPSITWMCFEVLCQGSPLFIAK